MSLDKIAWCLLLILPDHQEIYTNIATGPLSPEFKQAIVEMDASKWKTPDQGCATSLVAAFYHSITGK